MVERFGYRPPTEIDKEPPKENPIKPGPGAGNDYTSPFDDNTPPPNIGDDIDDTDDPLPPAEPSTDSVRESTVVDDLGDVDDTPAYLEDRNFADKTGRPIAMRTWESGDQYMIRAYDQDVQAPPEIPGVGQAGYANLTLERDADDAVTRARLNDIMTSPQYRDSGIGGEMLGKAEQIAQEEGAQEVYGSLSYDAEDESAVRGFYQKHGYDFRATDRGEEITKSFESRVDEPEPSKTVDNLGDDLGSDVSDDLGEIEDIGGDDLGDADFDTD